MKKKTIPTAAGSQYATAYDIHYTAKDLHKALLLYNDIIAEYPDDLEASYARAQIQNIANTVVPKNKLYKVILDLALIYSEKV